MSEEPWDKQRREKYRDHDLPFEDLTIRQIDAIRGSAVRAIVETTQGDQVSLIVKSFIGFLTANGYRITKKDPK